MLTVREAAQVLQLSRQGVIDMLRAGRLEGKRFQVPTPSGHYWLIPESEIERIREERK